jgi:hypothetical protein
LLLALLLLLLQERLLELVPLLALHIELVPSLEQPLLPNHRG